MNGSESHGYAQFSIKAGRVPIFMMPGRRSSNLHFTRNEFQLNRVFIILLIEANAVNLPELAEFCASV